MPSRTVLLLSAFVLAANGLTSDAEAGYVKVRVLDDFPGRITIVENDPVSTDIVMVRPTQNGTNTYHLIPPGESVEVNGAQLLGGPFDTVEAECLAQTALTVTWTITNVMFFAKGQSLPGAPLAVGGTLTSCDYVIRTDPFNTATIIRATSPSGAVFRRGAYTTIFVNTAVHVPFDPVLTLDSPGFETFTYTQFEVFSEEFVMEDDTELPPGVPQTGCLTSVAEIVIPKRAEPDDEDDEDDEDEDDGGGVNLGIDTADQYLGGPQHLSPNRSAGDDPVAGGASSADPRGARDRMGRRAGSRR